MPIDVERLSHSGRKTVDQDDASSSIEVGEVKE